MVELRAAATQHGQAVETMQADLGCLGQAKVGAGHQSDGRWSSRRPARMFVR